MPIDHRDAYESGFDRVIDLADRTYTLLALVCRYVALAGAVALALGCILVVVYGLSYAAGRGFTEGKQAAWITFDGEEVMLVDPE